MHLRGVRTSPRCTPSGLIMTYEISLLSVAIVKLCVKLSQEVGGESLIRSGVWYQLDEWRFASWPPAVKGLC